MVGVSRSTWCTRTRSIPFSFARNAFVSASGREGRRASTRLTTGKPCLAEPMAFTTFPE